MSELVPEVWFQGWFGLLEICSVRCGGWDVAQIQSLKQRKRKQWSNFVEDLHSFRVLKSERYQLIFEGSPESTEESGGAIHEGEAEQNTIRWAALMASEC